MDSRDIERLIERSTHLPCGRLSMFASAIDDEPLVPYWPMENATYTRSVETILNPIRPPIADLHAAHMHIALHREAHRLCRKLAFLREAASRPVFVAALANPAIWYGQDTWAKLNVLEWAVSEPWGPPSPQFGPQNGEVVSPAHSQPDYSEVGATAGSSPSFSPEPPMVQTPARPQTPRQTPSNRPCTRQYTREAAIAAWMDEMYGEDTPPNTP